MSSQLPPNPILTTYQYWNWVNVDEATRRQRALDNNYMTFPTVQNYPTFFSKLFLVTDVALTKMANTSYVFSNLVAYFASLLALLTSTTWLAIQNFTGIETNAVNPISSSGTITIGSGVDHDIRIASQDSRSVVLHLGDGASATSGAGIHIGNGLNSQGNVNILNGVGSTGTIFLGTSRIVPSVSTTITTLNCPLTPMYSYPITNVDSIGYVITGTLVSSTSSAGAFGTLLRTISLAPGSWFLSGWITYTSAYAGYYAIGFSNNTSGTIHIARKGTFNNPTGMTGLTGIYLATSGFITFTTTTSMSLYLRTASNLTPINSQYFAVRLS